MHQARLEQKRYAGGIRATRTQGGHRCGCKRDSHSPDDANTSRPGYQVRDEINLRSYQTGSVGLALSGKDTGTVSSSPRTHLSRNLDGGCTVFGQVIDGMDVVLIHSSLFKAEHPLLLRLVRILPGPGIRFVRI